MTLRSETAEESRIASGANSRKATNCLGPHDQVLLHLARATGPAIDQVDIVIDSHIPVRDLVLELVEDEVATPGEVRACLDDLERDGLASVRGSLISPDSEAQVSIRPRGLVAARKFVSDVGRPETLKLTLDTRSQDGSFNARFDTGSKERDRELNGSGVVLAIFYLVAMERPSVARPLTVSSMREDLEILCGMGLGPKRGPGTRTSVSADAIRDSLGVLETALRSHLPLRRKAAEHDKRAVFHYLRGPFPEVRLVATERRSDARSWSRFLSLLKSEFYGQRAKRKLRSEAASNKRGA